MIRAAFLAILFSVFGIANATTIEEGKQYTLIEPPKLVSTTDNQIEVIDFFSYGCPHCATLAPAFAAWEKTKPANVVVKKVPVEFAAGWDTYAKLYYTAVALGVDDKIDTALFTAVRSGKDLKNLDEAAKIFAEQKIDADKFKSTFNSFTVATAANQGKLIVADYKVSRIPLVVVDGRYQTTLANAGSPQGLIDTLNALIAKVEERRKTATLTTKP
jgi:thiol:disulfide interchange protein DsbA